MLNEKSKGLFLSWQWIPHPYHLHFRHGRGVHDEQAQINAEVDEISPIKPKKTKSVVFIFKLIKLVKGKAITTDVYC
jgi:hypothetical protein